jgi:hypothetical protein
MMSPSDATDRATREEWRELGFFYELTVEPPRWRFIGSAAGLANLVELLDEYVRDPRNEVLSEHEHYGPYMYLKVETSESPSIDGQSIRGTLSDLTRLRELLAGGLRNLRPGQSLTIASEYSPAVSHPLQLEMREADFDPASADPALSGSAVERST